MNKDDIELPPMPCAGSMRTVDGITYPAMDGLPAYLSHSEARSLIEEAVYADRQQRHLKERAQLDAEWVAIKDLQQQYEADRQRRSKPVAYAVFADNGNIRLWSSEPLDNPDAVPLYAGPQPVGQKNEVPDSPTSDDLFGEGFFRHHDNKVRADEGDVPQCLGEPIAQVRIENDYMSRGHFYKGEDKELELIADIEHLPVGTKLYAVPQPAEPVKMPSDEQLALLFGMWGWRTNSGRELRFSHFKEMVQILLGRYGKSATPEGWQLVPIDATRSMIDAAKRVEEDGYAAMHKAMLEAAPKFGGG